MIASRARRTALGRGHGAFALVALFLVLASATVQSQSLNVSGDATWTLSAGFGDPEGLTATGYSLGAPKITQRLRLKLSGEVVPGLAVEADLDNFQSDNLQLLSLTFTRGDWTARFGDFRYRPQNPSVAQALSLKGVEAEGPLGPLSVGLTFARAQGIPAVKEFIGQSGSDTIRYVPGGPYAPTRIGGHLEASLEGASFFELGSVSFDPDFVDAFIVWRDPVEDSEGRDLVEVLTANDLGELVAPPEPASPVLAPGDPVLLSAAAYLPPPPGTNLLILAREPRQILRDQLLELIRLYNLQNHLEGDQRLTYPYSPGTASDAAFLDELFRYNTYIAVGVASSLDVQEPLDQGKRRRFYDLGHRQLDPESVEVTVVRAGQEVDPASIPELQDLAIHYDEGILDLGAAGGSIVDELDALEVTYRYRVESNVYTLGLSLAVDSERVFLNGEPLQRHVDYTIDYEAGILVLLVAIGPEDRLRVEYETFRGGLGGGGTYQRNVYGGRVGFELRPGWTLGLDLIQGTDLPVPPEEAAALGIMPNTHTVAGVRSRFRSELWEADLQLARSEDRFPFDDNLKPHQPNQVTALAGGTSGSPFLVAGHQNGLSVWLPQDPGDLPDNPSAWHDYGLGQGPAGVPVHDIAATGDWWFLATGGGLTAVNVGGENLGPALDSADRWHRYYQSDGLPSSDVRAVAVDGVTVWVGTAQGLVSAPLAAFMMGDDPVAWNAHDAGVGSEITAVATGPNGRLYVAGEKGLAAWDGTTFQTIRSGERLEAVAVPETDASMPVYAGGPQGLYYLPAGGDSLRPVADVSGIKDLLYWSGRLWVATASGLWVVEHPAEPPNLVTPLADPTDPLAALGIGPRPGATTADALWIGAGAQGGQPIALWSLTDPDASPTVVPFDEELIPPEDAYRYSDLPAGEHTAEGWKGSLALTRRFDRGQIYLNALRQEADFLPLGSTQRQDVFSWEAGGRWNTSERLTLALSHRQEERTPLARRESSEADGSPPAPPYRLWTDRLAVTWQLGPELELAYQNARRDDLDTPGEESQEDRYSATVREGFFDDRLTVGMGLEQVIFRHWTEPDQGYRAQNLLGELDGRIGEGFTLRIRYRRPLRVEERAQTPSRLSESISYGVGWDGDLGPVQVKLSYDDDRTQDQFPETRSARTQRASSRAEIPPVQTGPLTLTPNLSASWREMTGWHLSHQVRTEAGGGLDVGWSFLKLGTSVFGHRTEYLETGKRNDELRYTVTARWEGWQQLTPSLEWRRTNSIASLPGASPQPSTQGQTRASLQWRPLAGLTNTTAFAYTDRWDRTSDTYRYTLSNRVSYAFSPSTSAAGLVELSQGTTLPSATIAPSPSPLQRQVKGEVSASHRFSASWSAEALVGAVWGEKDEAPFTSYYTRLSARLTF